MRGSTAAPLVMVIFSDFQCSYCAQFAKDTLPEIEKNYVAPGRLSLAFRHLPLEAIHPVAFAAAVAANCADSQGRFWEIHDLLFQAPPPLSSTTPTALARTLGLDMVAFRSCAQASGVRAVRSDLAVAADLGVSGTPTFLIGTRLDREVLKVLARAGGAISFERFEEIVASAEYARIADVTPAN